MEGVSAHGGIQAVTQEETVSGDQTLRRPVPEQGMSERGLKDHLGTQSHKSARERRSFEKFEPNRTKKMGTWNN